MPVLSTLIPAAHILSYGTLLGVEFYQTFVGGVIAFRTLARPQFSQLQQKIFPVYFSMQSALPLLMLVTHPSGVSSMDLLSPSSPYFKNSTVPIGLVLLTGVANMLYFGPATTKIMKERKQQETREGKKYYDDGPKSKEMEKLNKRFGVMHGFSSLVNVIGYFATVGYGFVLAEKLRF